MADEPNVQNNDELDEFDLEGIVGGVHMDPRDMLIEGFYDNKIGNDDLRKAKELLAKSVKKMKENNKDSKEKED